MKKILIVLISFGLFSLFTQNVAAKPFKDDIVSGFIDTLVRKGEKEARTYVASDVIIPEVREKTPIGHFSGLQSPKDNVRVSIAYFYDGENEPERIAFIWEVTSNNDKITDIRVVYDGSNPFMNELKILKAYKKKYGKNIRGLANFPFDITHVEGELKGKEVTIQYKSDKKNEFVNLKVKPKEKELDKTKNMDSKLYYLKNGTKALCLRDSSNKYKLIFQYDNLQYTLDIDGIHTHPNDLIYVANSMFLQ